MAYSLLRQHTPKATIVFGAIEGLLLARVIGQLFAARDESWSIAALYRTTDILVGPWTWLDTWAGQPRFGARLELATLAAMVVVAMAGGLWGRLRRAARHER